MRDLTLSERMVERAREKMRKDEGIRLKARVPVRLWGRVKRCAEGACMPSEEWVCLACKAWLAGRFDGVTYDEKELLGTRDGSLSAWVRVPHGFEAQDLRRALAAGAAWHEPKLRKVTPQKGTEGWVEGRDYRVERGES